MMKCILFQFWKIKVILFLPYDFYCFYNLGQVKNIKTTKFYFDFLAKTSNKNNDITCT